MHAYQGEYDGLCGMYAVANAFSICSYDEESCSDLFRVACDSLASERWPTVLWEGTDFDDMKK